jgi:type III secretion protein N (ATPase)
VLSDKLAASGHYPAIDILESRSRLMDSVTEREHRAAASRLRELVAKHREIELLVQVGEYRPGQDAVADEALARIDAINAFLKQGAAEPTPFARTVQAMQELSA